MAIKHIIFDIDGTLIDTQTAFLGALDAALERKGAPHVDIFPYFSLPLADAVRDFGFTDAEFAEWNEDYAQRLSRAPLYEGVRELIPELAKRVRLAVVTSRKHDISHIGLTEHGLFGYFDVVIAADDVARPKPAPDPLNKYADLARCDKSEMVFIGDSIHDKECADSADVTFFAPAWAKIGDELKPFGITVKGLLGKVGRRREKTYGK